MTSVENCACNRGAAAHHHRAHGMGPDVRIGGRSGRCRVDRHPVKPVDPDLLIQMVPGTRTPATLTHSLWAATGHLSQPSRTIDRHRTTGVVAIMIRCVTFTLHRYVFGGNVTESSDSERRPGAH